MDVRLLFIKNRSNEMRVSKLLTVLMALLLVVGLSFQAFAGNPDKRGTAGAMELLIPMGAKGTALAGSNIASISGVDAMYWNPAGMATMKSNIETSFSYMKWIADVNVSYGALAFKTGLGTIGFGFQSLGFGDIAVTTEEYPNGNGAFYSPQYMTVIASYSRAMTDRTFIGINAKFISEKIVETSASTVALDMGVQYISEFGIKVGVALKNFGSPIHFDGSDLDRQVVLPDTPPNTPARYLRLIADEAELPSLFEIGLGYDFSPMEKTTLSFNGAFRHANFSTDQILVGIEANYNDILFLRGGYEYGLTVDEDPLGETDYMFGPAFGFGLVQPLSGTMSIAFDFAYRMWAADYFDNNMYFTAKLLF